MALAAEQRSVHAVEDSRPRWLQEIIAEAQLTDFWDRALSWVESTGCTESDLRTDEEAVVDIADHLGLRKYEVKRLRRVLGFSSAGPSEPQSPDSSGGSWRRGSGEVSPGLSPGAPGLTSTWPTGSVPVRSPGFDRSGGRRRMGTPLPQVEEGDGGDLPPEAHVQGGGGTSGLQLMQGGTALEVDGGAWNPLKVADGLTCKNTFFEIPGERGNEAVGPATCPPASQGWWRPNRPCSESTASPNSSPTTLSVQDIGATPSWSRGNTPNSTRQPPILSTQRKPWADVTPDWFTPVPTLQQQAGEMKLGSHFNRLLAEAAKDEASEPGTESEASAAPSLRNLSSSPGRRQPMERFPLTMPPPPPAPFPLFMMPAMQEPTPVPYDRRIDSRVRLSLAQELGVQHQEELANLPGSIGAEGDGGIRGERTPAGRGRRQNQMNKELKEREKEPRKLGKKSASGSPPNAKPKAPPTQPTPGVLIRDKPRPTRHRGSKEAKDPDHWPDDPFEGLPTCAIVDLGVLGRQTPEEMEEERRMLEELEKERERMAAEMAATMAAAATTATSGENNDEEGDGEVEGEGEDDDGEEEAKEAAEAPEAMKKSFENGEQGEGQVEIDADATPASEAKEAEDTAAGESS